MKKSKAVLGRSVEYLANLLVLSQADTAEVELKSELNTRIFNIIKK